MRSMMINDVPNQKWRAVRVNSSSPQRRDLLKDCLAKISGLIRFVECIVKKNVAATFNLIARFSWNRRYYILRGKRSKWTIPNATRKISGTILAPTPLITR